MLGVPELSKPESTMVIPVPTLPAKLSVLILMTPLALFWMMIPSVLLSIESVVAVRLTLPSSSMPVVAVPTMLAPVIVVLPPLILSG